MNSDTHFYLYAKGHYQRGDIRLDLARITCNRSSLKKISDRDVLRILLSIVFPHIINSGNPEYFFESMILDMIPDMRWPIPGVVDVGSVESVMNSCLKILASVEVADLDLGEPDKDILPIKD